MPKKSSDSSLDSHAERGRLRKLLPGEIRGWSKQLRELARELDDHADALENAGIDHVMAIKGGVIGGIARLQELAASQIEARVKKAIIQAGKEAARRAADE